MGFRRRSISGWIRPRIWMVPRSRSVEATTSVLLAAAEKTFEPEAEGLSEPRWMIGASRL
jgi:hypothetical protein